MGTRWGFFARVMYPHGSVAQLVERTTENREVTGSTPVGATTETPAIAGVFVSCGRTWFLRSNYWPGAAGLATPKALPAVLE